jgi:phosphatidylglycerophosphate synthase
LNKLELDADIKQHLMGMSKWSRFIAVMMMVVFLILLMLLLLGKDLTQDLEEIWSKWGMAISLDPSLSLVIFSAGIVFIIITYYFLLQFANKTRRAIPTEHTEEWIDSIRSLRLFFTLFAGITVLGALFAAMTFINLLNG